MIAADRIARLARNLIGDGMRGDYKRVDPIDDLPYPVELDLEDRATVLRLWSGEIDEITFSRHGVPTPADAVAVDLLRDVIVDVALGERAWCSDRRLCSCAVARAWRYLEELGRLPGQGPGNHAVDLDAEPF